MLFGQNPSVQVAIFEHAPGFSNGAVLGEGRILIPPPVWSSAFTRLEGRCSKGRLKAELRTDRGLSLGDGSKMRRSERCFLKSG